MNYTWIFREILGHHRPMLALSHLKDGFAVWLRPLLPGLLLSGGLAMAALLLRRLPGAALLSPMILAVLLGIVVRQITGPLIQARPGLAFAMRHLLRFAIVLLGLQITVAQILSLGGGALLVIALSLGISFVVVRWLGVRMGVAPALAELIAAGTSICGASAIMATNMVTRGSDADVAYALACITLWGTVALFGFPLLAGPLGLDGVSYGLWVGASVQEVGQVVGAAFQLGEQAGQTGTIAKLGRVMLLAPLVMALALAARRRAGAAVGRRPPLLPGFILGFVGLVGLNSVVSLPAWLSSVAPLMAQALFAMALAAIGLEMDLRRLLALGWRPMALGGIGLGLIASISLGLLHFI